MQRRVSSFTDNNCEGPERLAASHLLVPTVIRLGHVMSHRGALKSEGHQELLRTQTEMLSVQLAAAAAPASFGAGRTLTLRCGSRVTLMAADSICVSPSLPLTLLTPTSVG